MDYQQNLKRIKRLIGREERNQEILLKIKKSGRPINKTRAINLNGRERTNILILEEIKADLEAGPDPPKLHIKNGEYYYLDGGRIRCIFIGNAWREILWCENGDCIWPQGPGKPQNLAAYEFLAIYSKINYLRENASRNIDLTVDHCKRMAAAGIVVELTTSDENQTFFPPLKDLLDALKNKDLQDHVFIEGENEFLDDESRLKICCDDLTIAMDEGFITSAGAYGNSHHGDELAEEFDHNCSAHIVRTIHRPYPSLDLLQTYIQENKKNRPVNWNEVLIDCPRYSGVPIAELEIYIRGAIQAGANAVCIYPPADHEDQWGLAGSLTKEFNP